MPFVLDASVTLAWGLKDAATAYSTAVLARTPTERIVVPTIWALEVANVVLVSERRKRLSVADSTVFLRDLADMPITVDTAASSAHWGPLLTIARAHNLSAYDASYIELALRHGLPLATQDNRLRAVAAHLGVPIFDPQVDADSTNGQGTT